ncbi:MAG: metallopeptidase family protein [Propionibacteriaceae bacterium]|nr:metallopeptidase family protein [Propionibacteriaceae bacterium]
MRDRHRRGLRGMLAPPNCVAGQVLRLNRPTLGSAFFLQCITDAIAAITDAIPDALTHVDVLVEDVPDVSTLWSSHMPLAAAIEADKDHIDQIVIYRRPIELRAGDRTQLRRLVFIALVEQVSSTTGISVADLDPSNIRGD